MMKKKKKRNLFKIIYIAGISAFTAYMLLDTFVIPRKLAAATGTVTSTAAEMFSSSSSSSSSSSETQETEGSTTAAATSSSEATVTDTSYKDDNISITIKTYRENDTNIYVADVQVSSPEYLKAAFANGTYGKNITENTSTIADSVSAILAINGDYYGAQETGYVIRDGVLYREEASSGQEDYVIYQDGSCKTINESDITARQLLDDGAWQVLSFGPGLVENGKISVTESEEVGKAMVSNPRTAIGMIDDCHYVFVVSDGRTSESTGLTLYQMAEFMNGLGVTEAYNLDGGGSSTMVFNGKVINNPTTNGNTIAERAVSDIVYIGY